MAKLKSTHGEIWYQKKVEEGIESSIMNLPARDPKGTMTYYKLKLAAAFGMCDAFDTPSDNFAAVEIYRIYCESHGYKPSL